MAARIAENMTRDILAAPVVAEVEVLPVPGTRVYLFGRTPLSVCLEISTLISIHRAVHGPHNLDISTRLHKEICKEFH